MQRRCEVIELEVIPRHKVALVHRRTASQRKGFLHKQTTGLEEYEGICIEDLSVRSNIKRSGTGSTWR